jgi:DHA1 family bicyclomycin/chloramphenicol resistance-like MFS transporter
MIAVPGLPLRTVQNVLVNLRLALYSRSPSASATRKPRDGFIECRLGHLSLYLNKAPSTLIHVWKGTKPSRLDGRSFVKMNVQRSLFALFLGALAALPPISIDMALPALGPIAHTLHVSTGMAQLTLSFFMAGFALSPIAYGPLSDRYGRRPMLILGLALFTLGALASSAAGTLNLLLLARFVQGAGAGSGMTLAMAMVRDLFVGKRAQGRLAVITVVTNVAPMIAPALGAALLSHLGWRAIYIATGLCGIILLLAILFSLQETALRQHSEREPFLTVMTRAYRRVLGDRRAMAYIVLNALGFSWMFAYITGSPLIFIDTFHTSTTLFAVLFACTGCGIVAGASLNGELAQRGVEARRLLLAGVITAACCTSVLVILTLIQSMSLWSFLPLLTLTTASFGMVAPSAAQGALEPLGEVAGVGGGLLASMQMLFAAGTSSVVGMLFPRVGVIAMTGSMCTLSVLALALAVPLARRAVSTRVTDSQGAFVSLH